jgi:hypothetical protein
MIKLHSYYMFGFLLGCSFLVQAGIGDWFSKAASTVETGVSGAASTVGKGVSEAGQAVQQAATQVGQQVQQVVDQLPKLKSLGTQTVNTILKNVPDDAAKKTEDIQAKVDSIKSLISQVEKTISADDGPVKSLSAIASHLKEFGDQIREHLKIKSASQLINDYLNADPALTQLIATHDAIVKQLESLDFHPVIGLVLNILTNFDQIIGDVLDMRAIFNRLGIEDALGGSATAVQSLVQALGGGVDLKSFGSNFFITDALFALLTTLRADLSGFRNAVGTINQGHLVSTISDIEGNFISLAITDPSVLTHLINSIQSTVGTLIPSINQLKTQPDVIQQALKSMKSIVQALSSTLQDKVMSKVNDWKSWIGGPVSAEIMIATAAVQALLDSKRQLKAQATTLLTSVNTMLTQIATMLSTGSSLLTNIKTIAQVDIFTPEVAKGLAALGGSVKKLTITVGQVNQAVQSL